jgi:cell division protein FtsW
VLFGLLAFFSASFGLLSRSGASFSSVIASQLLFGLLPGVVLAYLSSRLHYTFWRRFALLVFILTIGLNLLLLVPNVGLEHGGAIRWIQIGTATFQPSELLKIAFIIYLASWLSGVKEKIKDARFGILPLFIILGITVAVLILQRDTDNAAIVTFTALAMYFVMGAKMKDLAAVVLIGGIGLGTLFYVRPYLMDRVLTFLNPSRDPQNSSYQVNQSLLAVGSGGFWGRGFGQSVQKYLRLPEPIGDSIYAVIGEEFGFVGAAAVLLLFAIFALQGMRIAIRSPDFFGRLLALGIVILIATESFVNITSILGIFPVAGLPLVFISHGGSSMLASLGAVGIVLNVSRYTRPLITYH